MKHQSRLSLQITRREMKLLLLFSLAILALSHEAFASQRLVKSKDEPQTVDVPQTDPHLEPQPDKTLEKRSPGYGGYHGGHHGHHGHGGGRGYYGGGHGGHRGHGGHGGYGGYGGYGGWHGKW